jgi:hypothetical protein
MRVNFTRKRVSLIHLCIDFLRMAKTHMLRLDRVQYRGIRIALELMCLTQNNSVGVFRGMVLLAERFVDPNFRYLVAEFCRLDHPLKKRLESLKQLNMGYSIVGYSEVSLLATHFVDDHMEKALSGVQPSMYSVVAPRELLMIHRKISSPAGIFTAELIALFVTLQHTVEII